MWKVVSSCFQLWVESALDALNLLFLRRSRPPLASFACEYLVVAYLVSSMSSWMSWMSGKVPSLSWTVSLVTHFSRE